MNLLVLMIAFATRSIPIPDPPPDALAGVALYNPTRWAGPALVEVPTGRVAAPGLIDWTNVRLVRNGEEVPFFIREGRAHWRARRVSPAIPARAEDLLVFWCEVLPGDWARVDIVPGKPAVTPAVERTDSAVKVRYLGVEAEVETQTGMLTGLRAHGALLLRGPMKASVYRVGRLTTHGGIGPGYQSFEIALERGAEMASAAKVVSVTSTPAITEILVHLIPAHGPDMGITYRIHASGLVEIVADERPWEGVSPWLDAMVSFALPLAEEGKPLPLLEEREPFYGFKDHNAAFDQFAQHVDLGETQLIALGDEIVNGRQWRRRLFAWRGEFGSVTDAVEMLDEGLVVNPIPVCSKPIGDSVRILEATETGRVERLLKDVLTGSDVGLRDDAPTGVRLAIVPESDAVSVDGFEIREEAGNIVVRASNLLGLHQAVRAIADHGNERDLKAGFPLISRNPVVPIRGGGFGGGNFEVDFPYGSEEEWQRVFDALLDSGMNVFWCLGMWSNWKFPVSYKYMPELQSDSPEAYDESSGVLFVEADKQREHALRLLKYLHDRGAPVYLWLPIGCVPTTFLDKHPEALKPGAVEEFWGRPKGTPCFTHPVYHQYLNAYLRELVETYDLDGVVLVRDDNGGICDCDRCKAFVAASRTKNAAWEQYLQIHGSLRGLGFKGVIGVYPYFDGYTPSLDPLLPEDLVVAGHGASLAALARRHDRVGHMPDTWIDNLYANFRLPPTPRVRRLLGDRGTFWIGGAYCGTELPWEAIGYFGWEPTATPNSLRYHWGGRSFGASAALPFVAVSDAYELLWDINARFLSPKVWMVLTAEDRVRVTQQAEAGLATFHERFTSFQSLVESEKHATWLAHMRLWPVFFEYHLRRLGRFAEINDVVKLNEQKLDAGESLPAEVRAQVLSKYDEIYDWAERYRDAVAAVPGDMLANTRNMTMPYKEWMAGYDGWLDPFLSRPQFRGTMETANVEATAGRSFTVRLWITNTGICPWIERAEQALEFSEDGQKFGLPGRSMLTGEAVAPGDRRELEFTGTAPEMPGTERVTVSLYNPLRASSKIAEGTFIVTWK